MNFPKVSVIVPIYNVEKYLNRCVKSLLDQTLKEIEIILVDDESPDNCPMMCDEYAKQDSRVKVIHKKNGGLGFARNSGLEIALGEYVAYVDSDDYVDSQMFGILYKKACEQKLDAIFCGINKVNTNRKINRWNEVIHSEVFDTSDQIETFIFEMIGSEPSKRKDRKYEMSVCRAIYSRGIIEREKIRFNSERQIISEDIIYQIDFLSKAKKIEIIPEHLYYYCENNSSLTNIYRFDRYERYKILHIEIVKLLTKLFPNKTFKIKLSANRLLLGYIRAGVFYNKREDIKRIVSDDYLIDVIKEYPFKNSNFKDKVFILSIINRQVLLIEFLFKVNRLNKKWKKLFNSIISNV